MGSLWNTNKYFFNYEIGDDGLKIDGGLSKDIYKGRTKRGFNYFSAMVAEMFFSFPDRKGTRPAMMELYYAWQFVDTLEKAQRNAIMAIFWGVNFQQTEAIKKHPFEK